MRAVVQRVEGAAVEVAGCRVAAIGPGLLALVGIARDDGPEEAAWMARKLPALRIFADGAGQMNRSLEETGGGLIVVSQFTLCADCRKGNRPSFIEAAPPERAEPLYRDLVGRLRARLGEGRVGTGVFGARMRVELVNDGPVTVELATPPRAGGPAAAG